MPHILGFPGNSFKRLALNKEKNYNADELEVPESLSFHLQELKGGFVSNIGAAQPAEENVCC
jgi:hypothetical protein